MERTEYILIIVNLIAGLGCAISLARFLDKLNRNQPSFFRYFAIIIGIYFVECIAIVMGMGIPVFSVGLAFIWGIVIGYWLRSHATRSSVLKTSFFLSLYSSLPAFSFILIPVIAVISGRNIINVEEGLRFGIPNFLPGPFKTILVFYLAITIGALVLKTVITVFVARLLLTARGSPGTASNS